MGLMSHSEQQQALEKMKTKYVQCPNCRTPGGAIVDVVGFPILARTVPSGIGPGDQMMAALPLVCGNCGHMTFFAAKDFVKLE